MSVTNGAKAGTVRNTTLLGMGGVYRSNDARLRREAAVKVSAEIGGRFQRRARAVASLIHPNTCTLSHVGPNYLAMELVEGPMLAGRIKEGPMALEEALEAAHEKGITHRDLKPAKIAEGQRKRTTKVIANRQAGLKQ